MNSRVVLMAGFGGLLLLMAFAGLDGMQALRDIQTSNDDMRQDFLRRTRLLERIRGDVYVSGTYVRDYLLEPDSGKAEGFRYDLVDSRKDMDAALAEYRSRLSTREAQPFQVLNNELADYWRLLDPVLQWTPAERRRAGYVFLRDEVFPRRQAMLRIADQIGAINESQLNAGETGVRETFHRFSRRLIITLALTIGLGLVLAAFSMRKILRLEQDTAAHFGEVKQLSARLVEAHENERRSISRELHDEVGQALTGVLVEMANLSTLVRTGAHDALQTKADEIKKEVENSIGVVRNMALLLRPSMLDDLGLVPALQWQAREVSRRGGIWVKVAAEDVSEQLPEEHKTAVYRVVQEALHNCVRHAGARNVKVSVRQAEKRLFLRIDDDGKGFDAAQKGMGLVGMQERVRNLDGSFVVESEAGKGTSIQVELPL
ncbi:MAG TPA: ATP-binding protein [Ktedonobacterales bacterium]|nr:ATP-binding protein [Ktedonobacterales bacterium]